MTGIVIHKNLNEGDYVRTGSRIYQIADLTHLWVQLDAYESDLPHIHYGQQVSIQAESYPGRVFEGWVSFIDPVLNQRTQTVRVRVNVENRDGRLKPGMFVRTKIVSSPSHAGGGIAPRFKGKWICPMHPEVVEDQSGACRVCGMNLVKAEELGRLMQPKNSEKPLVIPVTAALITGRRAIPKRRLVSGIRGNVGQGHSSNNHTSLARTRRGSGSLGSCEPGRPSGGKTNP